MGRQVDDLINEMLDSVEQGDVSGFAACFEPDAIIWHNTDEKEMSVPETVDFIGMVCSRSTARRYEAKRIVVAGETAFVQQVLRVSFDNGDEMRCPVMLRIDVSPNGLISRLDEYFDSRATDGLAGALGLASAPLAPSVAAG